MQTSPFFFQGTAIPDQIIVGETDQMVVIMPFQTSATLGVHYSKKKLKPNEKAEENKVQVAYHQYVGYAEIILTNETTITYQIYGRSQKLPPATRYVALSGDKLVDLIQEHHKF